MLTASFGLTFFMKTPRKETNVRVIYLRITVDGVPKETSTRQHWDVGSPFKSGTEFVVEDVGRVKHPVKRGETIFEITLREK